MGVVILAAGRVHERRVGRELLVAASKAPKLRRPTKATRGSKLRRLASKKRRSARKEQRRTPGMDD